MNKLSNRKCIIDKCQRKYYAKNYCKMHYQRLRTHGDPNFLPKHNNEINCEILGCKHKQKAKGYCINHYKTFIKYGNPLHKGKLGQPPKFNSLKDNFESKYIKSKNGCWEWISNIDKGGYGRFFFLGS